MGSEEVNSTNYLRPVAFALTVGSSVATCLSMWRATSGGSMEKTAAYGALAFGSMAATVSGATAWFNPSSKDAKSYLKNAANHFFYTIPTMSTTVASSIFNSAVNGISKAVQDICYEKVKKAYS